jgi:hypothetical protein
MSRRLRPLYDPHYTTHHWLACDLAVKTNGTLSAVAQTPHILATPFPADASETDVSAFLATVAIDVCRLFAAPVRQRSLARGRDHSPALRLALFSALADRLGSDRSRQAFEWYLADERVVEDPAVRTALLRLATTNPLASCSAVRAFRNRGDELGFILEVWSPHSHLKTLLKLMTRDRHGYPGLKPDTLAVLCTSPSGEVRALATLLAGRMTAKAPRRATRSRDTGHAGP